MFTDSELARFDAKTVTAPNGCIEWTGALRTGYGQFHVRRLGANIPSHRASWMRHNGPIPNGLFVCHKCDNRKCVNPEHLFLGSPADNSADMVAKGRGKGSARLGAENPMSKLKDFEVEAIKASTASCRELAEAFGVSKSQIHRIKKGVQWALEIITA